MRQIKKTAVITLCLALGVFSAGFAKSKNYNVYTPTVYKQSNLVRSNLNQSGDVIELVVDYSSSMEHWINLAKSTLVSILPKVPSGTNVGLRVFGQSSNDFFLADMFQACKASRLVNFPQKSNTSAIISGLNSARIGSATPLTYALEKTVYQDFSAFPLKTKKKIILVTDGGETCHGNPCSFVKKLAATRSDIVIDVIIVNGSDTLRCLSDSTNGKYYKIGTDTDFGNAMGVTFGTQPESSFKPQQGVQGRQQGGQVHYQYIK